MTAVGSGLHHRLYCRSGVSLHPLMVSLDITGNEDQPPQGLKNQSPQEDGGELMGQSSIKHGSSTEQSGVTSTEAHVTDQPVHDRTRVRTAALVS